MSTEPKVPGLSLMVVGLRGAGVTTQLDNIYKRFGLRVFDFQDQMLQSLQKEKEKRKRDRYLARGFKAREVDEDGNEQEDDDPEVNEESETFDVKQHEAEVYTQLLQTLELQYEK